MMKFVLLALLIVVMLIIFGGMVYLPWYFLTPVSFWQRFACLFVQCVVAIPTGIGCFAFCVGGATVIEDNYR